MKTNHKLTSPLFITALLVLLANDFCFKPVFANVLTGKLSDFAGLFIFPVFWAFFGPRYIKSIFVLTALCFVYWKSPFSQPFINAFNALMPFNIGRTVDYTDLLALAVLPLSYRYFFQCTVPSKKINPAFVLSLCAFAFMATSYRQENHYTFSKTYAFECSKDQLKINMAYYPKLVSSFVRAAKYTLADSVEVKKQSFTTTDTSAMIRTIILNTMPDSMGMGFYDSTLQQGHYEIFVAFKAAGSGSVLRVENFSVEGPKEERDEQYEKLLPEQFEKNVIGWLRTVDSSSK